MANNFALAEAYVQFSTRDIEKVESGIRKISESVHEGIRGLRSFNSLLELTVGFSAVGVVINTVSEGFSKFSRGAIESLASGKDFFSAIEDGVKMLIGLETSMDRAAASFDRVHEASNAASISIDKLFKSQQGLKDLNANLPTETAKAMGTYTAPFSNLADPAAAQGIITGLTARRDEFRKEAEDLERKSKGLKKDSDRLIKGTPEDQQSAIELDEKRALVDKAARKAREGESQAGRELGTQTTILSGANERAGQAKIAEKEQQELERQGEIAQRQADEEARLQADRERHDAEAINRLKEQNDPEVALKQQAAEIQRLLGDDPAERDKAFARLRKEFGGEEDQKMIQQAPQMKGIEQFLSDIGQADTKEIPKKQLVTLDKIDATLTEIKNKNGGAVLQ
jgi:hypothetical protein